PFKRDYVRVNPIPDATTALADRSLDGGHNTMYPQLPLTPRVSAQPQPAACPALQGQIQRLIKLSTGIPKAARRSACEFRGACLEICSACKTAIYSVAILGRFVNDEYEEGDGRKRDLG